MTLISAPEAKEVLDTILSMLMERRDTLVGLNFVEPLPLHRQLCELEYNILCIAEEFRDDLTEEQRRIMKDIERCYCERTRMQTHDPRD